MAGHGPVFLVADDKAEEAPQPGAELHSITFKISVEPVAADAWSVEVAVGSPDDLPRLPVSRQ